MNNLFRLAAALCIASFAVACGGPVDDQGDDSADDVKVSQSEPITWVAMSKKAAEKIVKTPNLVNVAGQIGVTDGFVWHFTFFDYDAKTYVTVQSDGSSAHVTEHHKVAAIPYGGANIQLDKVKVTLAKLTKEAASHGLKGRVTSIQLSEALTVDMHPHWFLDQGGKELMVDAFNGAVLE